MQKSLYNWIMNNPQVVQSPVVNYFLKVNIDGHTEPQLVPKLLLQVSVQELHNNLVSDIEDGGLKEAGYADNNIIISDSTLDSLFFYQDKNSCLVVSVIYLPKVYISNHYYVVIFILKTQGSKLKC